MSNGIDFVIGGKDNAKPAMASVEKSLMRLELRMHSIGNSTKTLAMRTAAWASASLLSMQAAQKLYSGLTSINAAYDAQADPMGKVAESNEIANESFRELMVSVGKILAPFRVLINTGVIALSEALTKLLIPAVQYMETALDDLSKMTAFVTEVIVGQINGLITAFTVCEVVFANFADVFKLAMLQVEFAMTHMVEELKYAFTVKIPTYLTWFKDTFIALHVDMFNAVFLITNNFIMKIVDSFNAMWTYILTGGQTDVMWELGMIKGRSLLGGFESALKGLPAVGLRQLTEQEKELAKRIAEMSDDLGNELDKKLKDRLITIADVKGQRPVKGKDKDKDAASSLGKSLGEQSLQATEARLLTRGPGSSIPQKILEAIKTGNMYHQRNLKQTELSTEELDKINENTSKTVQMVPVP